MLFTIPLYTFNLLLLLIYGVEDKVIFTVGSCHAIWFFVIWSLIFPSHQADSNILASITTCADPKIGEINSAYELIH